MLAGEGHNSLIWAMSLRQAFIDSIVILNASRNACGNYHRTGFAPKFFLCDNLLMEVFNHHCSLFCNDLRITFYKSTQLLLRTLLVEHRIILDSLHDLIPGDQGTKAAEQDPDGIPEKDGSAVVIDLHTVAGRADPHSVDLRVRVCPERASRPTPSPRASCSTTPTTSWNARCRSRTAGSRSARPTTTPPRSS